MNLEQLIFTWKGRQLVLALFLSIYTGLILEKKDMHGHNCGFSPLVFSKLGHLECYIPLNGMYFLSF